MTGPVASVTGALKGGGRQRKLILGVAAVAVGYVGYQWWKARGASDATVPVTGDVGAPLEASGIVGAPASGNIQYAGTTTDTRTGPTPGNFASNAEWTDYAVDKLSSSGGWSAGAVYAALGDFLARRPLDDTEAGIVRAAVAAAGNPPVGGPYTVIGQVGQVTLKAPTGLKVAATTRSSVDITFSPVPGATGYYAYRSGIVDNVSGSRDTKITVSGLSAGKTYKIQVAAFTSTGKVGPKSTAISATTKK